MARRTSPPQVHKFGGASLRDADAVRHAVSIAAGRRPAPVAVVVSAMAGVTDALLDLAARGVRGDGAAVRAGAAALRERHRQAARKLLATGAPREELYSHIDAAFDEVEALGHALGILRELTPRSSDFIVAHGELLSARLVTAALGAAGVEAEFIDPREAIRTDGGFGGASPDIEATDRAARKRLGPALSRGVVPVVPGFLGATPDGELCTLGRGGSDLTATLLGRALRAQEVSLWKDVAGLLTADPRVVPDARVIPQLHVREAAELAYYGAKVLHPRALIPIAGRSVPLFVRPFGDPTAPGTEISGRRTLLRYPVKALSAVADQALVTVTGNGMLGVPGIAARTFTALHREGISVSLISQASSEHSICFSVPTSSAERARRSLEEAFEREIAHREIDGVELRAGVSTLAVVGLGMAGTPGIASRVFTALAGGGVNVEAIAQGSSELNISVVVDAGQSAAAQRVIHAEFQMSKIGGGAVAQRGRVDVVLLGFGQIGQALAGMITKGRGRPVTLRVVAAIDQSGFVFDAGGLSRRRLDDLARAKRAGTPLGETDGAHPYDGAEAVRWIARHALSRPILVDVTAGDTVPALAAALEAGMDLVLANKRPLAACRPITDGLFQQAKARGRRLLHETTVGAGLPVIDTYYKLVESGDRVVRIEGCPSGTLGFLMTEVGRGRAFSDALRLAMSKGYTEPDPRDDLSGMDVARKALILGRLLGYGGELTDVAVESLVPPALADVPLDEFLARLPELDAPIAGRVADARANGAVLRYVATVTRRKVSVGLRAVDGGSPFASLKGTDNQFALTTERYNANPLVITGPGAGAAVTAAGVLNDVLRIAGA
jgi:aspartokinase/homoserine dehydrogenase 1